MTPFDNSVVNKESISPANLLKEQIQQHNGCWQKIPDEMAINAVVVDKMTVDKQLLMKWWAEMTVDKTVVDEMTTWNDCDEMFVEWIQCRWSDSTNVFY